TLALATDIDEIVKAGFIQPNWQKEFPNNSAPYPSTVVFLVRKGNPKNIRDWNDLTKPGVEIIKPNPQTGGAPRWIYLSAWGYALTQPGGNAAKAQ
uniref:substrate-binding domain-containing protein n=1 Tax=Acinetobacter baumannii TaxID=470 RepID=UPI000B0AD656